MLFIKKYEKIIYIIKNHFLSINRILENKLLLNTIYLMFIIFFFTLILFFFSLNNKKKISFLIDSNLLEILIWIIPAFAICSISYYSIKSSTMMNPLNNIYKNIKPLIIEIISINWKWIFVLPIQKIITINEICIPILVPIKIYLISNNIMNSFCIPKLGYHLYCMNNCIQSIHFLVLKHGISHLISSNYCGIGNKYMRSNIFFVLKKTFFYWIQKIQDSIYFDIFKYNNIINTKFLKFPKFFLIKNNKIFFSIIKKI